MTATLVSAKNLIIDTLPYPMSWSKTITDQSVDFTRVFFTLSAILLLVLLYVWKWKSTKTSRASPLLPPGPRGLPLVGNLLSLDPELHTYFTGLAQTYGPILKLRLGTKIGIVVTSPSLARVVLREHDVVYANRDVPVAGRVGTYGGSDLVSAPYGPEWRMLRKVCVLRMFSTATLDSVYGLRRREVRNTVGYLYSRVGSPLNVGEQMFLTILNVITSMLWGGTVEGDERAKLGAEFRQVVSEITGLLGKPNISDFYPGLARFDLQGVAKDMAALTGRFDKIFEKIISQRSSSKTLDEKDDEGESKSKDFLQYLLEVKDEGDAKTPLTMSNVKALLMLMEISVVYSDGAKIVSKRGLQL
ncbi:Cytochrome P [Trema orientale]|uniref:Cytochrome P n=1 Tax=Trema orientale TaxID=63057 RepID=A0A2P5FPD5_TREOI|nr:Cytochrome P [Trema orientale]